MYTFIPETVIEKQLEDPQKYGEIAMILFNLFTALVLLKYLIILILVICIVTKNKKA